MPNPVPFSLVPRAEPTPTRETEELLMGEGEQPAGDNMSPNTMVIVIAAIAGAVFIALIVGLHCLLARRTRKHAATIEGRDLESPTDSIDEVKAQGGVRIRAVEVLKDDGIDRYQRRTLTHPKIGVAM